MAVLAPPIHIKGDTNDCIRYIQDPEKVVADKQTMQVIRYMQSHCVEEISSVGYNGCSGIRELAVEQFRAAEARYKASHPKRKTQVTRITVEQYLEANHKKRLPKHIKPDADGMITITKTETAAEHLVISAHQSDNPTPEKMQAVIDEFMQHPYLRDHPALSNLHWNTDKKHGHILISNYSRDGGRKLSLSGTKLRELRRYLDKICYKHGLSIIDTREARLDPEHAKWIDQVKAEGKIKVWDEKEVKGNGNYAAARKRKIDERLATLDKRPSKNPQLDVWHKDITRNELYVGSSQYVVARYKSRTPRDERYWPSEYEERTTKEAEAEARRRYEEEQWRKMYYVRIYVYDRHRHRYRQRTLIELIFELAKVIITGESEFLRDNYPKQYALYSPPNRDIQDIIDSISIVRDLNVRTPNELYGRAKEIGAAIGDARKAVEYDRKTIENNQELYEAVKVWTDKGQPESLRKAAYAVLASHKCTNIDDMQNLAERYERAVRRLPENEQHLENLNKSYRSVKKAIASLEIANERCRQWNDAARAAAQKAPSIDQTILRAKLRTTAADIKEKERENPKH